MNRNLKHITILLLLVSLVFPAFSQSSMSILKGKKRQKVSFEFINNLIIVPVRLNGKELSFILDSGARNTILFGSSKSDSLVLNEQIKTKVRGIGSGKSINAIISRNNRLQIKNIYGFNQKIFVLLDDQFDLSLKMGKPIHGIIGYELFKNFVTKINYQTRKLSFYDPKQYTPPSSEKYLQYDLDFYRDKPYVNTLTKLNDSLHFNTKLLIDTGCSDALWLFEDNKGLNINTNYFEDYLGAGISGSIIGKRTKIHSFALGDFVFNNVTAAFLDSVSTLRARSFKERKGSIGSGLLERFKVIFDYPNKKMYLKKAKSFKEDFKYNRAGLGVAYHKDARMLYKKKNIIISELQNGENQQLFNISYEYKLRRLFYIYYVRPNSAAEKAGLKANDIIIEINDKPSYEYELERITGLFYGNKGERIKMHIERKGFRFYYEFKLSEPLLVK